MAKVTITFEDDGDAVDVRFVFDPPLHKDDEGTAAQWWALDLMARTAEESEPGDGE